MGEDYGYITLEAMLSSKAVITCADPGGPLEFIRHGETGLIAEPSPEHLAAAMDQLWQDRESARRMGQAGRALTSRWASLGKTWSASCAIPEFIATRFPAEPGRTSTVPINEGKFPMKIEKLLVPQTAGVRRLRLRAAATE
jgi:hypothetical protein